MSLLKANAVQLGQSLTATNNFTWYQPSSPDGTVRLGNGNSGSVTDLVTLTSAGNLGIGTSSPADSSARLTVSGTSAVLLDASGALLRFNKTAGTDTGWLSNRSYSWFDGNGLALSTQTADPLRFGTNSAEVMRLDASGNLGLGVTPSGWVALGKILEIGSKGNAIWGIGGNDLYITSNAYYDSSWKYGSTTYATAYEQYNGTHKWLTAPSGTAGNAISFTQAMTLDASGNLLVGTTSSPVGNARFRAVNATSDWSFGPNNGSSFLVYNASSVGVYIANGATSWTATSDERLKTDLKPIENAAQKVSSLRAVTGRFKTDDKGVSRSFLIAQDVQAVLPEAVDASDPDKLGVQYTDTIPLLVAAIKELSAELNELKGKIA